MVDPGGGRLGDFRLGLESHAEARLADHGEIIGPIAHRHGLGPGKAEAIAQLDQGRELCLTAEDRLLDPAGKAAALDHQQVGAVLVEAEHGMDRPGEQGEAAGDQRRVGPIRPHGPDEFAPARRQGDALVDHLVDDAGRQALQQGDTFAQRRLEVDLAAHGALGDLGDMGLHADHVGELVDAFLTDHGRIHVGKEQPLPACRRFLDEDIDRRAGKHRPDPLRHRTVVDRARRCERDVGGDAGIERHGHTGIGQGGRDGLHNRRGDGRTGRVRSKGDDVGQAASPAKRGKAKAVLIAGPTASGKSALALALAERFGGVVINADSMQVYRDLRVITARPSAEEMAAAPHRLYGTVDGQVNFSVARWIEAALAEIAAAEAAGLLPILIGGTGLYFKALTQGISDIPPVPDEVRQKLRAEAEGVPAPMLHQRLAAIDPASAAKLRPNDPQRTLRALEVFVATGRPLVHWQQDGRGEPALPIERCAAMFLSVEREPLRRRIDDRFVAMMAAGALDEVAQLAARRLDPALPVMRAHGVPGLIAHLAGEMSLAEAIAKGQKDTRAYAKRQETWFRHQMAGFAAVPPNEALGALTASLQV